MELKEQRNKIVNEVTNELTHTISEVYNNVVKKRVNSKLPESVFKKYFLPYFTGELELTSDNGIIYKWIEYAGSVHAPMDIIDNTGKVIDTIPPIANSIKLDKNLRENMGMATIGDTYNKKKNISPSVAKDYLDTFTNTIKNNLEVEDNGFLKKIQEYSNNKQPNKNSTIVEDINDDLDYD